MIGATARVEAARNLTPYTSTQENAWMVLAARALARDAQTISLEVGGEKTQGALNRNLHPSGLQQPLRVTSAGDGAVQAVVTVSGAPIVPEPAVEKGFKIERKYYTLAGTPADPTKAKQNDRFAVVLKITEPLPQFGRIIVADYLPAGFEIDNPRLVSSGDTGTLAWIEDAQEPVNAEFRDDRFSAAFQRKSGDPFADLRGGGPEIVSPSEPAGWPPVTATPVRSRRWVGRTTRPGSARSVSSARVKRAAASWPPPASCE